MLLPLARLISGLTPDKTPNAMFFDDKPLLLSDSIKEMLVFCLEALRDCLQRQNKSENVELNSVIKLLRKSSL